MPPTKLQLLNVTPLLPLLHAHCLHQVQALSALCARRHKLVLPGGLRQVSGDLDLQTEELRPNLFALIKQHVRV